MSKWLWLLLAIVTSFSGLALAVYALFFAPPDEVGIMIASIFVLAIASEFCTSFLKKNRANG